MSGAGAGVVRAHQGRLAPAGGVLPVRPVGFSDWLGTRLARLASGRLADAKGMDGWSVAATTTY